MSAGNRERRSDGTLPQWWFNTKTGKPEFGLLSAAPYRIGPFPSEDEAANALEIVQKRAQAWAADDEADR